MQPQRCALSCHPLGTRLGKAQVHVDRVWPCSSHWPRQACCSGRPATVCRRMYSHMFEELRANERLLGNSKFHLTLLGKGRVELPGPLASRVSMMGNLDYRVSP